MPFVVYDGEKVYREALEGFQKQLDDLKKGNSKENTKEEDEANETSMRKTTQITWKRCYNVSQLVRPTLLKNIRIRSFAHGFNVKLVSFSNVNLTNFLTLI